MSPKKMASSTSRCGHLDGRRLMGKCTAGIPWQQTSHCIVSQSSASGERHTPRRVPFPGWNVPHEADACPLRAMYHHGSCVKSGCGAASLLFGAAAWSTSWNIAAGCLPLEGICGCADGAKTAGRARAQWASRCHGSACAEKSPCTSATGRWAEEAGRCWRARGSFTMAEGSRL